MVHVAVDAGGREDEVLTGDGVSAGAGAESGGDALHHVGVAGLADAGYLAVLDADVGLDHAQQRVKDGDIGDDGVEAALLAGDSVGQAHAVAQGLAAAVHGLVAQHAEVLLDLHVQVGVGQADLVAHGGAEKHVVL